MLVRFFDIKDLKYSQLMEVYLEDNTEKARFAYSDMPLCEGLFAAEQDLYGYLRDDFFCNEKAFCAAWEVHGRYVSFLRVEPYLNGYLICGISTHTDFRRRGYGKKLLTGVLSQYLSDAMVYSHIHQDNAASVALHVSCGFKKSENSATMLDGSVLHNYSTFIWDN